MAILASSPSVYFSDFVDFPNARYVKLPLLGNANKGWNADKDGYFQHLDPPTNSPKLEPSSYTSHGVRVYNVDETQQKLSPGSHCPSTGSSNFPNHFQRNQLSPFKGYNGITVQQQHQPQQQQPIHGSLKRPSDMEVGLLEEMMDTPVQHKTACFSQEEHYHSGMSGQSPGISGQMSPGIPGQPVRPHVPSTVEDLSKSQSYAEEDLETPRNTDREDVFFTVIEHPLKHQVKEFNILPAGILQLMRHYQSSPSDYIVVKLLCDPKMDKGEIFLTAVSTHYSQSSTGEIAIPSLKVSQKMLPGRTKGFTFRLMYELVIGGKMMQSEVTDEFFIWSNVNQKGYPRKERDAFITQRIESNKKKIKPKRKTPGRPRKKENDEIDFEDE